MNICERRGIINPPNMSCRSLPIDNTRLTENPTDLLLKACHSTVSEIWGGIGHTTPPSAVLCLVTQSCPTLFVTLWTVAHQAPLSMGILQARILEWVAMPSSRGSSQLRDQTCISLSFLHWQTCSVFCHTSTWISHWYTYVPSLLNWPPTSCPFPPL